MLRTQKHRKEARQYRENIASALRGRMASTLIVGGAGVRLVRSTVLSRMLGSQDAFPEFTCNIVSVNRLNEGPPTYKLCEIPRLRSLCAHPGW